MYVSTPRPMCMCIYDRALSRLGNNEASVGSPNCVYCITVRGQKKSAFSWGLEPSSRDRV